MAVPTRRQAVAERRAATAIEETVQAQGTGRRRRHVLAMTHEETSPPRRGAVRSYREPAADSSTTQVKEMT